MLDEFVAIDLETTGLNMETDQIIEVGATRFDRFGHFENFSTFVNPGRSIPREVRELTHIEDADLVGAPRFIEVRDALAEFIGERTIVGQNIAFDLAFLRAEQIHAVGPTFDTWELASVLLPTATRLNLASLAAAVGVEMPVAHRALADAEATRDIFIALLGKLDALPRTLLLELRTFAARAGWAFSALIDDAVLRSGGGVLDADEAAAIIAALPSPPVRGVANALVPREHAEAPTAADIDALFALAAARTDLMPGYERRSGQETMARAVAQHLGDGGALAVEAGTGTGKSLAYLLPALLHALRNDDRVVISTHTLNLQDQLATKELPIATALVEDYAEMPGGLRTTILKGRGNYLCLERWAQVRIDPAPRSEAEARLFGRVAAWLPETETGDLSELYMTSQERPAWDQISADDTDCMQRRCAYVRDGSCFLLRSRQRAAAAHAVIVNHALLMANAARADQVLPPFRHLIIDEAHRLEDVATQHYGAAFSARDVRDLVESLGQTDRHSQPGFARRLQGIGGGQALALSPLASLAPLADRLLIAQQATLERVKPVGDALRAFAEEYAEESPTNAGRREISLTAARRAQPAWEDVEETAMHLDLGLQILVERLTQVRDAAAALPEGASDAVSAMRAEAAHAADALASARDTLRRTTLQPRRDDIAWLSVGEGDQRLQIAPLEVGDRLIDDLYGERESVLLTSATLTAGGSFDFTLDRLGLRDASTLEVPSPFNYRQAVLALTVEDLPEPGMPGYDRALHETLADAVRAAGGRTLALFTSHAAVRTAAGALRETLAGSDIMVLAQGIDGSPGRLLRMLVERPRTLLLGTAAFWEGVDVQGDALSQIVIARLPFPVPNEPIYAGRAEQFQDPFAEFAVPQSVLRFRQGFGRLIRSSTDRGVFLVLDSRIVRRSYGETFLDSLPDCDLRQVRGDDVSAAVEAWLR